MLQGQLSTNTPVAVPAAIVWELFSGMEAGRLITQLLGDTFGKVEVLEGDGGVGTLIKVTFAPGTPGPSYMKEKIIKVDHGTRIKESEVIEGGYKDLGFKFVGSRVEILEKDSKSCIVRWSLVYEVDDKLSDLPSKLSIKPLEIIMGSIAKHLGDGKGVVTT
ncbi:hypothetical protein ACFE04_025012 [Oxalis oulophora]